MSPTLPASSPPDVGVVIPAGGRGERAGAGDVKQFRPIGGVPMLLRALRPFEHHPAVREIVIALPAAAMAAAPSWLAAVLSDRIRIVAGGATRAASVAAALHTLSPVCGVVVVHDAARPFAVDATVNAVIARARGGVGAVAAAALTDTLKRTDGEGRIMGTVDRTGLWRAQTPQAFPRAMLDAAVGRLKPDSAEWNATDDAALVEAAGFPVEVIPDTPGNIKVTSADDFLLAEALARR